MCALQSLAEQAHPRAVIPKTLDPIAATTSEDVKLAGKRVLGQVSLNQRRQSVVSPARMHFPAFPPVCPDQGYALPIFA